MEMDKAGGFGVLAPDDDPLWRNLGAEMRGRQGRWSMSRGIASIAVHFDLSRAGEGGDTGTMRGTFAPLPRVRLLISDSVMVVGAYPSVSFGLPTVYPSFYYHTT